MDFEGKNMKNRLLKRSLLVLSLSIVIIGGFFVYKAIAAPALTTEPTKITSAEVYVKASSDWQNTVYFQVTTDSTDDYLKQVRFTINSIAGMGDGDEIT
jgi:hypothetical protein